MPLNRSTARTVEMLSIISESQRGVSLVDIVKTMNVPKSSAFDILHTLIELGMVDELEDGTKRYTIGYKAFEIGNSYLTKLNFIQEARSYVEQVANTLRKTTFLSILDGNEVVYVYKHEPAGAMITTCSIGSRNNVYSTSLGKALLANIDRDVRDKIIDTIDFVPITKRTITSKDEFKSELELTKQRGYSLDDREGGDNLLCIGAPIFDHSKKAIASISASGFYKKDIDLDYEVSVVKQAAHMISTRLGYK